MVTCTVGVSISVCRGLGVRHGAARIGGASGAGDARTALRLAEARNAVQRVTAGSPLRAALTRSARNRSATISVSRRAGTAALACALGSLMGTRAGRAGLLTRLITARGGSKVMALSPSCGCGGTAGLAIFSRPRLPTDRRCPDGSQAGRSVIGTCVLQVLRPLTAGIPVSRAVGRASTSVGGAATSTTQGTWRGGPAGRPI